jgi:lysophospholipase L1-like esterase
LTSPSPRRRRLFLAITLALPVAFFAVVEGVLRLAWPAGDLRAFDPVGGGRYLVPGRRVARRYFAGERMPPVPPVDPFAAVKPARSMRIFVMGESTAAGFPYPPNGTFSRALRDALRDVLPQDSVEVVNVGIAATNSYTMLDLVNDVIAQRPDAVLIYGGHNEYYGALGVGSSIGIGSSRTLVRAYLVAERLRTVLLLRDGITAVAGRIRRARMDETTASFMESIARDQQIRLGGPAYQAGLAQLGDNLGLVLGRLRDAGVPAFVASIVSNVRDQPPFASPDNGAARAAFDSAARALARADSGEARRLFVRARDLDVIRFRAPSALNDVIRATVAAHDARYVPVSERFDSLSPAGAPGHELFLEHVHPTRHGYMLIASSFFGALRDARFLGRAAEQDHLASWADYESRMELTPFDDRVAAHTVRTVTTRWPFVARDQALDYRGTYRPVGLADSLALLVSRGGIGWAEAKARVAADAMARGHPDSALAEYRGLIRDRPLAEPAYRLAARAALALHRPDDAVAYLERARTLAPTAESYRLLGGIALERRDLPKAITLLDSAVTLDPTAVASLYQLSLAFGLSGNAAPARAAAARAAALAPDYPGLAPWMATLGMRTR